MSFVNSGLSRCPSCGEVGSIRKSKPRIITEKILKFLPFIDLYKCKKCGWRGWKTNLKLNSTMIKKLLLYFLLAVISAIIVYNILKLVI